MELTLSKEDVFGHWTEDHQKIDDGLVISRGTYENPPTCPIWGDKVPWKSVTIVCTKEQVGEVEYWCVFVHGGDCISKIKHLGDNKVAIRSNYMAW